MNDKELYHFLKLGEKSKDHKYIERVNVGSKSKPKYLYFYSQSAYQKYLRRKQQSENRQTSENVNNKKPFSFNNFSSKFTYTKPTTFNKQNVVNDIKKTISNVKNIASKAVNNTKNTTSKTFSNVKNTASKASKNVKNGTSKVASNAKSAVSKTKKTVEQKISDGKKYVNKVLVKASNNINNIPNGKKYVEKITKNSSKSLNGPSRLITKGKKEFEKKH